jgi:hypothetical protein
LVTRYDRSSAAHKAALLGGAGAVDAGASDWTRRFLCRAAASRCADEEEKHLKEGTTQSRFHARKQSAKAIGRQANPAKRWRI